MLQLKNIELPASVDGSLPTAIAFPAENGPILFGDSALQSERHNYNLLTNWKLLLAMTPSQLNKERLDRPSLERILSRYTLDDICTIYFRHVVQEATKRVEFEDKPQLIIGTPTASESASAAARARYTRHIEVAFQKLGLPKPRFFPEAFAVFQYLWSQGKIPDVGGPQNVFILDIGGGTTNVCVIRTSARGRLARGGRNHLPYGVGSLDIGGSTIDQLILDRVVLSTRIREVSRALFSARQAKETISCHLNTTNRWLDPGDEPLANIHVEGQGDWPLSPRQLTEIIERRFWPNIKELIIESLGQYAKDNPNGDESKINIVILAGGSCQADIFKHLFIRDMSSDIDFEIAKFINYEHYHEAVAQGLAIEAHANNRLYEVKPTRISPFLQSNLHFFAGNNRDQVGTPDELEPSDPNLKSKVPGVLLPAPLSLTALIGNSPEWAFKLKQRPDTIFYGFQTTPPGRPAPKSLNNEPPRIVQVRRGRERPGAKFKLRLTVREDGFADLGLEAWYQNEGQVSYTLDPIDLHELADMGGDVFLGLDFGTSATALAYVNIRDPSALEALPSSYWTADPVAHRARELETEAKLLLGDAATSKKVLERWNQTILADYVYHSNRIEGSALGRGTTIKVLDQVGEGRSRRGSEIIQEISEKFSYIDDKGRVQVASRPVKDHVAAANLRDAFLFVNDIAMDQEYPFTPFILKQAHNLIMRGEDDAKPGEYRKHPVKISQTTFVPPDPVHIESLIEEMFNTLDAEDFSCRPVIYQAAYAHARFVSIHPFQDGNGRLARLLVNYFLWKANLPGILLPWENRARYYDALEECNTNELPLRGDLTDLVELFCDLFEDSLEFVKNNILKVDPQLAVERAPDEPVIEQPATSDRLGRLLEKITSSKFAISEDEQFENWSNSFRRLIAETVSHCEITSRVFKNSWAGGIEVREFPLIERDLWDAIRYRRSFARPWYLQLIFKLPSRVEEVIFYFVTNSIEARQLDPNLAYTACLRIARYHPELGRHVTVARDPWTSIREFFHDGSRLGMLAADTHHGLVLQYEDGAEFRDWFAVMIEDLLRNCAGFEL